MATSYVGGAFRRYGVRGAHNGKRKMLRIWFSIAVYSFALNQNNISLVEHVISQAPTVYQLYRYYSTIINNGQSIGGTDVIALTVFAVTIMFFVS